MSENQKIQLTQTVQKGGCAAKIAASELRKILTQVKFPPRDENLLIDGGLFDDAAIYKVNDEIAMVQTLDFFTPIVDTPKIFGQIAAANSLSDVYAMGGVPKTAMGILAFPLATMESSVIVEMLQGACEIMAEAKTNFVGGHSIDDDTLKFGLSVTGYVNPNKVWSNAKAQSGDLLILTKPLGTGTATAALKRRELNEDQLHDVLKSMITVNSILDLIPELLHKSINSATDITGFGLAGHSMQMAKASEKSLEFDYKKLPIFPISHKTLKGGFLTKAHKSNALYTQNSSDFSQLSELEKLILFDPQTSGGLLLSVNEDSAQEIVQIIRKRFQSAEIIGKVEDKREKNLYFRQ